MEKEIISTQQGVLLVIILLLGTSITVTGPNIAKQDIWISILISCLAIVPIVFIYGKLLSLFPNKNLFEILEISFGKTIGKFISSLYILYFIYMASLCMRNITEFLQVSSLPSTPQLFSSIWIIMLAIYMVYSGIEVLARWNKLIMVFIIFLLTITNISSIPKFDFQNIRPILYEGWKPIFASSLVFLTFPFGELVVFLSLFNNLKSSQKSFYVLFLGLAIGGLLLLMTTLRNMFLLGFPGFDDTYFPTYYGDSLISLGGFIQGIELLTSIILILSGFAKVCITLFAICIGLKELFNSSTYKFYSTPVGIIIIIISLSIYRNTMEMIEGIQVYKYIALPFQIVFPALILLFSWRKSKIIKT